jgi:hypothetical protein
MNPVWRKAEESRGGVMCKRTIEVAADGAVFVDSSGLAGGWLGPAGTVCMFTAEEWDEVVAAVACERQRGPVHAYLDYSSASPTRSR